MSATDVTIDAPSLAQLDVAPRTASRSKKDLWIWAMVACFLLATSGVVRTIQGRRHNQEMVFTETCPFSFQDLTSKVGVWKLKEGSDQSLDPLTMRITGGTDHILRTYVDELTGVTLVVLLLYGPAEPVLPHIPEVCYPSSGYSDAQDSGDREIAYTTKDSAGRDVKHGAIFRSSVYEKSGGLHTVREEVFHSFRLDGVWSPDVARGRKLGRRNPGVFKLQIQRPVVLGEDRGRDNPIDQFLSVLIPELERQIAIGSANKPGATK
jgi:Protein of unknown function (DUF3485)